jgi:iron(III) transport system substrate-binding protein
VLWVYVPTTLQEYGKRGLLENYSPANAANIRENFKDPSGQYTGTAVTFVVVMYNSKLLARRDAPTSWSTLTDSRYRDQLIFADPRISGTGAAVVSALLQTYGWKYWEAVARNRPILAPGHPDVLAAVTAGKRTVSPMQDLEIVQASSKGQPVGFSIPAEGAVTVGCYAAIVKSTRNLQDAKRLVDFLASDDAAVILASMGMYHTSRNAKPPKGWPNIEDIKPLPFDWAQHEATKKEMKEKFVATISR